MSHLHDKFIVEIDRIGLARRLASYELSMILRVTVQPTKEGVKPREMRGIWSELLVDPGGTGYLAVATLQPRMPYEPLVQGSEEAQQHDVVLTAVIAPEVLAALETARAATGGQDLRFLVNLRAVVAAGTSTTTPSRQDHFPVPRSVWLQHLDSVGFKRTMLIEVPLHDERNRPHLATAAGFLQAARGMMDTGHYRDAVAKCREALNALAIDLGDGNTGDKEPGSVIFDKARHYTKGQRLRMIRASVRHLGNLAAHPETAPGQVEWDRDDAFLAITMTAALIRRLGAVEPGVDKPASSSPRPGNGDTDSA